MLHLFHWQLSSTFLLCTYHHSSILSSVLLPFFLYTLSSLSVSLPLPYLPYHHLSHLFSILCPHPLSQVVCHPPLKQSRLVGRNRTSSSMTRPKALRCKTLPASTLLHLSCPADYPRPVSPWPVCLLLCPRLSPWFWNSRPRQLGGSSRLRWSCRVFRQQGQCSPQSIHTLSYRHKFSNRCSFRCSSNSSSLSCSRHRRWVKGDAFLFKYTDFILDTFLELLWRKVIHWISCFTY